MINARSSDIIVHMVMEPATVRIKGGDRKVLRPSVRGFSFVEFDDGEMHPISHPLEMWILDAINRSLLDAFSLGTMYFQIDPPGERSNDGQDLNTGSVNNIQTHM